MKLGINVDKQRSFHLQVTWQTCDQQEAEYHLLKFNTIASSSNRAQSHDKKLSIIYSSDNHDTEDEVHYHYYHKY